MMMEMHGTLFKYGKRASHIAFKSSGTHKYHVVAVHGLTDGLLFTKYLPSLNDRLQETGGVGLVQASISSSGIGWGTGSISRDAEEINLLCKHLKTAYNSQGVFILGHSTGCQDAVMYATKYKNDSTAAPLLGTILQAPVSDREFLEWLPQTKEATDKALACQQQGRLDEIAFFADFLGDNAPVTARRWLSLVQKDGEDDMFSSDFTSEELKQKLGGLSGIPTLIMISSKDEYAPLSGDYVEIGGRFAEAIGEKARLAVIEGGMHCLDENIDDAVELIAEFVESILLISRPL